MSSVNRITLIGRLGADPEIRYTQGGQPVCNLRVATTEIGMIATVIVRKERSGMASQYGASRVNSCGQYLAKGRQVYLEGRLQSREYTDRDGVNRKVWEVVASNVVFLSSRGDSPGGNWGVVTKAVAMPKAAAGVVTKAEAIPKAAAGVATKAVAIPKAVAGVATRRWQCQGGGWFTRRRNRGGNQGGGWGSTARQITSLPAQNAPAGGPDDDDPIPF